MYEAVTTEKDPKWEIADVVAFGLNPGCRKANLLHGPHVRHLAHESRRQFADWRANCFAIIRMRVRFLMENQLLRSCPHIRLRILPHSAVSGHSKWPSLCNYSGDWSQIGDKSPIFDTFVFQTNGDQSLSNCQNVCNCRHTPTQLPRML